MKSNHWIKKCSPEASQHAGERRHSSHEGLSLLRAKCLENTENVCPILQLFSGSLCVSCVAAASITWEEVFLRQAVPENWPMQDTIWAPQECRKGLENTGSAFTQLHRTQLGKQTRGTQNVLGAAYRCTLTRRNKCSLARYIQKSSFPSGSNLSHYAILWLLCLVYQSHATIDIHIYKFVLTP